MSIQVINHNGKVYDSRMIQAVDHFLGKMDEMNLWDGIDNIVRIFLERYPSFKERSKLEGANEYASTKDKSMRQLLSLPPNLKDVIETIYQDRIHNYKGGQRQFWIDFAKKHPVFTVADKI